MLSQPHDLHALGGKIVDVAAERQARPINFRNRDLATQPLASGQERQLQIVLFFFDQIIDRECGQWGPFLFEPVFFSDQAQNFFDRFGFAQRLAEKFIFQHAGDARERL